MTPAAGRIASLPPPPPAFRLVHRTIRGTWTRDGKTDARGEGGKVPRGRMPTRAEVESTGEKSSQEKGLDLQRFRVRY